MKVETFHASRVFIQGEFCVKGNTMFSTRLSKNYETTWVTFLLSFLSILSISFFSFNLRESRGTRKSVSFFLCLVLVSYAQTEFCLALKPARETRWEHCWERSWSRTVQYPSFVVVNS